MEGFDAYASNAELTAKWLHGDYYGANFIKLYPYMGRRGTTCAGPDTTDLNSGVDASSVINSEAGAGIIVGFANKSIVGIAYGQESLGMTITQHGNNFFNYGGNNIDVFIMGGTPFDPLFIYINGATDYFYVESSTAPWPNGFIFTDWHYVEFKLVISDSIPADSCVVKIDGFEVLNLPEGTDTTGLGDPNWGFSRIRLGSNVFYDDIYVCDTVGTENNDFLGDSRVDVIRPAGDGTYSQGTPTTGTSHYSLVNQVQYNPTVGIVLDTTEDKESYTMSQLLPSGIVSNDVHGIELATVAYNLDGSGSKRMGKLVVQGSSELELNDSNDGISTSASFNFQITPVDADAAQWTVNSVNNAQFGIVLKP
jgi:hypothetical protein